VRFLFDQNTERRMAAYLRRAGHDVTQIARDYPHSLPDRDILVIAYREQRILVTNDNDFGELIFVDGMPHAGVLFFRMWSGDIELKISRLEYVLQDFADHLHDFIVITEKRVRVRSG
jgi:predicted nuclease of predicted toxin-antitoxin system